MALAQHMAVMTSFVQSLGERQGSHTTDLHVLWQDWEYRYHGLGIVRPLGPARQVEPTIASASSDEQQRNPGTQNEFHPTSKTEVLDM